MLTRRTWLASLAGAAISCTSSRPSRPPNFVFLMGDDHRDDVAGFAGNPLAETPNLDRLAAQGTRFTHHFVNYPMCSPSRQSLMTGLLPHASGVSLLRSTLDDSKTTLAHQFKKGGYRTAAIGKMHFNRKPEPGLYGFDVTLFDAELQQAWERDVQPREIPADTQVRTTWRPFRTPASEWLNAGAIPYARYDDDMRGTYIARKAVEFLEEPHEQPFALWVSMNEPHSPFDFPVEFQNRFDPAKFPVPEVGPEDKAQIPLIFRNLTREQKQGIIAAYYTSVAFMDRNMGRVLDALDRRGLTENTLVVYWGDHGYSLGDHGRFEKHCFYERSLRSPLIFRWPGKVKAGLAVDDLVETVDISATIADLLGLEPLPGQHGQSLKGYLEGGAIASPRDHIFSEYLHNEEAAVRTARWKFIYCTGKRKRDDGYETDNPTPGRYHRLFDLQGDPDEFFDVSSKNPEVVAELKNLMLTRFRKTHPEAGQEPSGLSVEDALDWYLRPRDPEQGPLVASR